MDFKVWIKNTESTSTSWPIMEEESLWWTGNCSEWQDELKVTWTPYNVLNTNMISLWNYETKCVHKCTGARRPHNVGHFKEKKNISVGRVCACICNNFMAHVVFGLRKEIRSMLETQLPWPIIMQEHQEYDDININQTQLLIFSRVVHTHYRFSKTSSRV